MSATGALGSLNANSATGPIRAGSAPLGAFSQRAGTSKTERRPRSLSPPPPPIAAPLLEMGFSLKHVIRAINATGSSGEMSAHTINQLATWMIEHPCIDSTPDEGSSTCARTMVHFLEFSFTYKVAHNYNFFNITIYRDY